MSAVHDEIRQALENEREAASEYSELKVKLSMAETRLRKTRAATEAVVAGIPDAPVNPTPEGEHGDDEGDPVDDLDPE